VYRDVYLDRARTLLSGILSGGEFRLIERERAQLADTSLAIARAMDKSNWALVRELSSRGAVLRQAVEGKSKLMEIGRDVYAVTDIRLDPFLPGLLPFTRIAAQDLPGLRAQTIDRLATLERADAPWQDFYTRPRTPFQALDVATSGEVGEARADPREAAAQARHGGRSSAGARRRQRPVRWAVPSPRSQPGLRLGQRHGTVRGSAPRARGGLVTTTR
jgi:hypothetical protein